MQTFIRFALSFALGVIAIKARPAAAQATASPSDRWQLTLNDERYLWDVRLVKLAGDTLMVQNRDSIVGTPIARINEMRLLPETILLVGDGHHSAISALAGSNPNVYDLAKLGLADRRSTIQRILSHQTVSE
jgi:hypothetical protein